MKEMFEASVDGEAFDMERWGQYFKPAGMGGSGQATGSGTTQATPVAAPKVAAPAVNESDDEIESTPTTTAADESTAGGDASSRAADIIAMIRKRQTQ
jgi:hypothetical protein